MKTRLLPNQIFKILFPLTILVLLISVFIGCAPQEPVSQNDYYQIKVYQLSSQAQMDQIESYLKNAYIPALHRAGIPQVGVFKPREQESETSMQVWVWLPFHSFEQFEGLEQILANDSQYQTDGADYINAAYDNPPYDRIETTFLKAFAGMPHYGSFSYDNPVQDRVYELRSYESATEKAHMLKVDMFNSGEIDIFKNIGANPLFFAKVLSGATMPNLMYMTTYADTLARKNTWSSFSNHPDWKAMKQIDKYKNTVSKHVHNYLYPTEYSDI